jgi:FixJ family two-component response regulator
MSGRDLANRLAAVRPELPVVFMSGYTDAELARHGVLERRFLRKPFSMPSLLSTVRAALDAE